MKRSEEEQTKPYLQLEHTRVRGQAEHRISGHGIEALYWDISVRQCWVQAPILAFTSCVSKALSSLVAFFSNDMSVSLGVRIKWRWNEGKEDEGRRLGKPTSLRG